MAVYKVIQDVEAEDKILGPLSLKGFIYAAAAGLLVFISIRVGISGAIPLIKLLVVFLFLPPVLLFGVLASPLGREQPTEVWLLSHLKFLIKPRTRKWDQNGIKDLVTITVPKKVDRQLTKDINQVEVSSRLQALANTLDSRGWAVKNVAVNLNVKPYEDISSENNDRLAQGTALVKPAQNTDINVEDDMLDEQNNPTAQNLVSLVKQADDQRKRAIQERLEQARAEASEFQELPTLSQEERQLLDKVHRENQKIAHTHISTRTGATTSPMTAKAQAVKLELAQSGNDLSVASIARLASHRTNEVVIPLH